MRRETYVRTGLHGAQFNSLHTRACASQVTNWPALAGRLGVPEFYEHQRASIAAAVDGRDVLIVAPTGSGKSEVFFGAGIVREGLTLIVSPLRSLIADQYRRLTELDLPVRIWNSDVREKYKTETLRLLRTGFRGFVITTPEGLKTDRFARELVGRVDLAVIDEAHCVLRDRGFRVPYAWLGGKLASLRPAVRMACTATLAEGDHGRLNKALQMREPLRIVLPCARAGLRIRVVERGPRTLAGILERHAGEPGIVFCATVRTASTLHAKLHAQGRRDVLLYHGRLKASEKKEAQDAFMQDSRVVVATDAFLLGIDKSNIRVVVHYDPPKSIEDWVQGFGRAGRDGKPADVYGCFRGSNEGKSSRQFLINATFPPVVDLQAVWEYILKAPFRDETQAEIARKAIGPRAEYSAGAIMTTLQRHRLVEAKPHPDDGRRKLYAARGDFERVSWETYTGEYQETCRRFERLCELASLADAEIPAEIDRYFGAVDEACELEGVA